MIVAPYFCAPCWIQYIQLLCIDIDPPWQICNSLFFFCHAPFCYLWVNLICDWFHFFLLRLLFLVYQVAVTTVILDEKEFLNHKAHINCLLDIHKLSFRTWEKIENSYLLQTWSGIYNRQWSFLWIFVILIRTWQRWILFVCTHILGTVTGFICTWPLAFGPHLHQGQSLRFTRTKNRNPFHGSMDMMLVHFSYSSRDPKTQTNDRLSTNKATLKQLSLRMWCVRDGSKECGPRRTVDGGKPDRRLASPIGLSDDGCGDEEHPRLWWLLRCWLGVHRRQRFVSAAPSFVCSWSSVRSSGAEFAFFRHAHRRLALGHSAPKLPIRTAMFLCQGARGGVRRKQARGDE
jgi:hypothetical protein